MPRLFSTALLGVLAAALAVAGCGGSSTERRTRPTGRSSVLITQQELSASNARDAYQAVLQLRPDWLRSRGAMTITGEQPQVVVYLDGQRFGPPTTLAQISAISIKELRYYNAADATQRWGTGHAAGVIEIVTR